METHLQLAALAFPVILSSVYSPVFIPLSSESQGGFCSINLCQKKSCSLAEVQACIELTSQLTLDLNSLTSCLPPLLLTKRRLSPNLACVMSITTVSWFFLKRCSSIQPMKITLQGIPKCGELQGKKRLICLKTFCHENDSQGKGNVTSIAKMREIANADLQI